MPRPVVLFFRQSCHCHIFCSCTQSMPGGVDLCLGAQTEYQLFISQSHLSNSTATHLYCQPTIQLLFFQFVFLSIGLVCSCYAPPLIFIQSPQDHQSHQKPSASKTTRVWTPWGIYSILQQLKDDVPMESKDFYDNYNKHDIFSIHFLTWLKNQCV